MRRFYFFSVLLFIGVNSILAQDLNLEPRSEQRESILMNAVCDSLNTVCCDSLNHFRCDSTKSFMKGSYLTVSVGGGYSYMNYKLNSLGEKGSRKGRLGYSVDLKYSYYFSPHWGVTTGFGLSYYGTTGKLKGSLAEDSFYSLGKYIDDDWQPAPRRFDLRTRVTNLEEKQNVYMLEIPLLLSYQTYFGDSTKWGMYGNIGAKIQLPVATNFRIKNGEKSEFNVSGKYEGIPTDMGSPENPDVSQHGYGTITDPNSSLAWDDDSKLSMGLAATAELGVLYSLSPNTTLQVGAYIDYGLKDMRSGRKLGLFTGPETFYHPRADNHVGNMITYNGMLNSNVTGKIKPISFGLKVALKFKLDKIRNKCCK